MVTQPDQDWRDRADQRHGAFSKDAIGIVLRGIAELACQQFADRVGIAGREGVECVAVLHAARDHKIQHAHVILAPKSARQREHRPRTGCDLLCRPPGRSRSPVRANCTGRLMIAVVFPAPVVPGIVMCCRASSAVTQSSCPLIAQPMNRLPPAIFGFRLPGVGLL